MNDVLLTEVLPDWAILELKTYFARKSAGSFVIHTDDRGEVVKVQPNPTIRGPRLTDKPP